MQLHALFGRVVGADDLLCAHDIARIHDKVVVILGVYDLALHGQMIAHADGGNDAFVVVRAEIARHAHGVCAVGHVKAQHAAAFLQAAARHGDNIALYHYPPGFQRDRAHGDALLLYHPAVEHVPCDGAARGLGRGLHRARRGLRRGVRGLYHGVVQREYAADKLAQLCFLRQRRHRGKPRAHGHAAACRLDLHVRHVCLVKPPSTAGERRALGKYRQKRGMLFAHFVSPPSLSMSAMSASHSSSYGYVPSTCPFLNSMPLFFPPAMP